MPKRKTTAQIRRMQKRAEARGEQYVPPHAEADPADNVQDDEVQRSDDQNSVSEADKLKIAAKLQTDLVSIQNDTEMNAKERRSAKRKAEAIAAESAGSSASELLEWYIQKSKQKQNKKQKESPSKKESSPSHTKTKQQIPYILFVGQLSFSTTADQLRDFFLEHLRKTDPKVHKDSVRIRLLTEATTKKSRGMAFCQVDTADTLFSLLQLHQSVLHGRRLNLERTTGSGKRRKASQLSTLAAARSKATQRLVDEIWTEFGLDNGMGVDSGVKTLCTRHATHVVRAAVERFVETSGYDRDNPSAYLTALVGKLATEGIYERKQSGNLRRPERTPTS